MLMANAPQQRRPFGQLLVDQGLVSADQLRIALMEQRQTRLLLGSQLVALGFLPEASLRDALATAFGLQAVDLGQVIVDPVALEKLPRELARRHQVFPLAFEPESRRLVVALASAGDGATLDRLAAQLGADLRVEARLAGEGEIAAAIEQHYGCAASIDEILVELERGQGERASATEGAQPVVRLVAAILAEAVAQGASDVHFEPERSALRIRYRIDGVLRPARRLHPSLWPAMAVRLKVMARMNIAETRAPQDGRITAIFSGRELDFRVASLPTTDGENVVLRVLDRHKGIVPLERLGLAMAQLERVKRMMARPEGLILVTGPTGSGKTTTLYSMLNHLNSEGVNIMTLEDPVEYPLPLIRQTAVSEANRIGFASGLRALMRQDPDVILVGEIRDEETAEMALRAAMTGHQVYSTLHTQSAVGAIPRLLDMGIVPELMAGNIIGVIAQRLVRRLCASCRQPHAADAEERDALGEAGNDPVTLHRPAGCERCDYQGFRGRVALMEILRIDAELDALIACRAGARELVAAARERGFRPLAEEGLRLVRDGVTSLEELARVVDLSGRLRPRSAAR